MFKIIIAAASVLGLIFGSTATAATVWESQPGDPLYAMKDWSWQVQNRIQPQSTDEDALNLQTRDQTRQQDQLQICDPVMNPDCELIQDQTREQTREQTRDQDRIHQAETEQLHLQPSHGNGSGDGTCNDCTPQSDPGPNGNGHKP